MKHLKKAFVASFMLVLGCANVSVGVDLVKMGLNVITKKD